MWSLYAAPLREVNGEVTTYLGLKKMKTLLVMSLNPFQGLLTFKSMPWQDLWMKIKQSILSLKQNF